MSLNFIFYISDFHNLKIVNNIFFFIFEGGLIFLSRGVYIEKLSLLLCLRGRQLRYLAGAVFLSYSIFQRVRLLLERLVLGEISFLVLLSLIWTLDFFSHITLKTSIFIEDSPRNKHSQLANQSQITLYTFTTF